MLIFAVIATISCKTPKEIAHQSEQLDTINDYSGTSGYFVDERDGKRYKWVRIGDQIWMAENLAFKADSGCVAFKHKERKANKYGYYYSWETAMQSCPKGWHLPTEKDIQKFIHKLGNSEYGAYDSLQKYNDYGLNLRRTGFYKIADKKFYLYYKFPYLGESQFWTSYFYYNDISRQIEPYYFFKLFFWKFIGVTTSLQEVYRPARCIKD